MPKSILIISPQAWGEMFVSKHHYAVQLAINNEVYFLNPPNAESFITKNSLHESGYENLKILYCKLNSFVWNVIKFKNRWLYQYFYNKIIKDVIKRFELKFDEVWCFDPNVTNDFKVFNCNKVLFFAADVASAKNNIELASKSNLIVSVTDLILSDYKKLGVPTLKINHGLSKEFENIIINKGNENRESGQLIRKVGYVGNLYIPYLNYNILENIVSENPTVQFYFWGAYRLLDSNLQRISNQSRIDDLERIMRYQNVVMKGVANSLVLANEINEMDAFLMCFDIHNDPNKGSNSHKILEYLSTGKVIIANKVLDYMEADLFPMLDDDDTSKLPDLFKKVISQPSYYNSPEYQQKRIAFALNNTYQRQVEKINSEFEAALIRK